MSEFMNTLLIACIPSVITGIGSLIVAISQINIVFVLQTPVTGFSISLQFA